MTNAKLKWVIHLVILVAFVMPSFAQNLTPRSVSPIEAKKVYSPATRDLNFVQAAALNTYCYLSKIFVSEEGRDKCFSLEYKGEASVDLSPINDKIASLEFTLNDLSSKQNVATQTETIIRQEPVIKYVTGGARGPAGRGIVDTVQGPDGSITFIYSDHTTFRTDPIVAGGVGVNSLSSLGSISNINIGAYNNSTSSAAAIGYFNNVLNPNNYVLGASNTIANASGSVALGFNINNNINNSIQIGLNDLAKITVLGTSTNQNGWVGLGGRTSPLNSGNCNNLMQAGINCNDIEMLRVPGKIVAKSFEVNSSADLAENFPSDDTGLTAGHIVQFSTTTHRWSTGGEGDTADEYDLSGIERASNPSKAIGVVATNPGVILGGNTATGVPVAFSGRVPVRVSNENGDVKKGDKITLSDTQKGVGVKLIGSGQVVGTALSDESGKGIVLMLVKNEYYYDANSIDNILGQNKVESKKENHLCIDDTCIDKSMLGKIINLINTMMPSADTLNKNI